MLLERKKMKVLYSDQMVFDGNDGIFLAGPTPRRSDVPSWRPKAIELLESFKFDGTVLVPEWQSGMSRVNFDDQVEWEFAGLSLAKVIVFWVPRNMEAMPALTTNVEFGYWTAKSPERIVYGRPSDAPSTRYLDWLISKQNKDVVIHDNLSDLLESAVIKAEMPSSCLR